MINLGKYWGYIFLIALILFSSTTVAFESSQSPALCCGCEEPTEEWVMVEQITALAILGILIWLLTRKQL